MVKVGVRSATAAVAALALLFAVACNVHQKVSGPDPSALQSSAEIEQGNSPYCNALSAWVSYDHFKVGGEGEPGAPGMPLAGKPGAPAANKAYRQKYLQFAAVALRTAPTPQLKAAWKKYYAVISGPLVALDEKYHYIFTSPAYQNILNNPPASFLSGLQAFDVIGPYENRVCGNGGPEPASVKYKGSSTSQFCKDEKKDGEAFQAVIAGGTKPPAVQTLVTPPAFAAVQNAEKAPPEIRADAVAYATWTRQKWLPLITRYQFDLPRLLAAGTSVERHAFNSSTPDISAVYARIAAYDSQVCGL